MSQVTEVKTLGWREGCRCCGRISAVGFHVPDHIWISSLPHRFRDAVLCIACFTLFADEAGVEWSKDITFYPVSLVRHQERTPIQDDVTPSKRSIIREIRKVVQTYGDTIVSTKEVKEKLQVQYPDWFEKIHYSSVAQTMRRMARIGELIVVTKGGPGKEATYQWSKSKETIY